MTEPKADEPIFSSSGFQGDRGGSRVATSGQGVLDLQRSQQGTAAIDITIRQLRGIGASDIEISSALGLDIERILSVEGTVEGGLTMTQFEGIHNEDLRRTVAEGAVSARQDVQKAEFEKEQAMKLQEGAALTAAIGLFDVLG
jgi:hypothetical protein